MPLPRSDDRADAALAKRALHGDPDAIGALFDRHAAALFRLAWRITASSVDADDVVQDVFVGLPTALRRYDERGSLGAWLRVVTTRVALDHVRRRGRRAEVALDGPALQVSRSGDPLTGVVVEQAVRALPEALRLVFVLHEVEGYAHAEIAVLLGIRVGTSQVRLHRALKRLRALLAPPDRAS